MKIVIWTFRIVGLLLIGYGLMSELFYIQFSGGGVLGGEYPLSYFLYPLIYPAFGLTLIILSRPLVARIWGQFNKDPYP